jgi:hypothetical protein
LFEAGAASIGFLHQFITGASPVECDPEKFVLLSETDAIGIFANND